MIPTLSEVVVPQAEDTPVHQRLLHPRGVSVREATPPEACRRTVLAQAVRTPEAPTLAARIPEAPTLALRGAFRRAYRQVLSSVTSSRGNVTPLRRSAPMASACSQRVYAGSG